MVAFTSTRSSSTGWQKTWDQLFSGKRSWSRASSQNVVGKSPASEQRSFLSSASLASSLSGSSSRSSDESAPLPLLSKKLTLRNTQKQSSSRNFFKVSHVESKGLLDTEHDHAVYDGTSMRTDHTDQVAYRPPLLACEDEECSCCETLLEDEHPQTMPRVLDALIGCRNAAAKVGAIQGRLLVIRKTSMSDSTSQKVWELKADLEYWTSEHKRYSEMLQPYRPRQEEVEPMLSPPYTPSPKPVRRVLIDSEHQTQELAHIKMPGYYPRETKYFNGVAADCKSQDGVCERGPDRSAPCAEGPLPVCQEPSVPQAATTETEVFEREFCVW